MFLSITHPPTRERQSCLSMYISSWCYSKQQKIRKQTKPDLPRPESRSWKRADIWFFFFFELLQPLPGALVWLRCPWWMAEGAEQLELEHPWLAQPFCRHGKPKGRRVGQDVKETEHKRLPSQQPASFFFFFPFKSSSGLTAREE